MDKHIAKKLGRISSILIIFIILSIDYVMPLGVADGILYIFALVLLYNESKKYILISSVIMTVLIISVFIIEVDSSTPIKYYLNRSIAIIVLWVIVMLILEHKKTETKVVTNCKSYLENLDEIINNISHHVRTPLVRNQGLYYLIENDLIKDQEEFKNIMIHMKENLSLLDEYTRDLSKLVSDKRSNTDT